MVNSPVVSSMSLISSIVKPAAARVPTSSVMSDMASVLAYFFHSTGRRHTESQSRDLLAFLTGTQIKIPVLGFVRNFVLTGQHDILLPVAEIDQTVHIIRQVNDRLDTTTEQTDIGLQRRQVILKFLVEPGLWKSRANRCFPGSVPGSFQSAHWPPCPVPP